MRPYVVTSSKASTTGTGTITLDRPASKPGDVLYAFISRADDTAGSFSGTGWTALVNSSSATGNDLRIAVLRKVVTGNEPESYTFTNGAGDAINMTAMVVVVRGANLRQPEDVASVSTFVSNQFPQSAGASQLPTTGHCLVLYAHAASMDNGVSGKTGAAGSNGFQFTNSLVDYVEQVGTNFGSFLAVTAISQTGPFNTSFVTPFASTPTDTTSESAIATVAIRPGLPLMNMAAVLEVVSFVPPPMEIVAVESIPAFTEAASLTAELIPNALYPGYADTPGPYVPGPTLALATPLLPDATYRAPYVPGPVLQVATDGDLIAAALYNLADLSTPVVADLDLFQDPQWQDLKSEPGAGSIMLQNDDPDLAAFADDGTDIIFCTYRGQRAFELIPDHIASTIIATEEEPDEVTVYSGLGVLGVLDKGLLDPGLGVGKNPTEEDRHFGWPATDPAFDHSSWPAAKYLGTVQNMIDISAIYLVGWTDALGPTIAQINQQVDQAGWPDRTVQLVGGDTWTLNPQGEGDTLPGDIYTYEEFFLTEDVDALLTVGADDRCITYLDGSRVLEVSGINWFGIASVAVRLTAGWHSIASVVTNQDFSEVFTGQSSNGAKYGWVLTTEPDTLQSFADQSVFIDYTFTPEVIASQNAANAKVLSYPNGPPGQSVTRTFRVALEETQARGLLPNVVCGFTDTNYSDGTYAEPIPDIGSKVGTDLLSFARELAASYVDIAARVVNGEIVIYLYPRNSGGAVTTVEFKLPTDPDDESTGNLNEFQIEYELLNVTRLLIRSEFGWSQLLDAIGNQYGAERALEIGAPASIAEVMRMAQAALDLNNSRRGEITAGFLPRNNAEAPYIGFRVRDFILSPTGIEEVTGITVTADPDDGRTILKISLRDVLLSPRARLTLDTQKALG